MNEKKKSPFIIRLFKGILIFLCIILISLLGWIGFSALDRMSPLDVIPSDYSVFVHTDSVWDAVSPIIDLKAADVLLADPRRLCAATNTCASPLPEACMRRFMRGRGLRRISPSSI